MKNKIIYKTLGSGLGTGYFPFATGTIASLLALLIYMIPGVDALYVQIPFIVIFFIIGIPIGNYFEEQYGKDPSYCTVDEFVGTWISLLFLQKNIWLIGLAFVIWRLFDIIKPFPANRAEKLNGGLGIMLDDVIAAIYTVLVMQLVIYLFIKFSLL